MHADRRRRLRVDAHCDAAVFFGNKQHALSLQNISVSGAVLVGDLELPTNSAVRLRLKLPKTSEEIAIDGTCVRFTPAEEGAKIAIRFVDLPDDVAKRIMGFVESQRIKATRALQQGLQGAG